VVRDMRFLIGVDIGTQSSKGALIVKSGQIFATHSLEHELTIPQPGWAEHDAERVWWQGFVVVMKELLAQSGVEARQVSAVGISALMAVMPPSMTKAVTIAALSSTPTPALTPRWPP
jgi:xylulokinase